MADYTLNGIFVTMHVRTVSQEMSSGVSLHQTPHRHSIPGRGFALICLVMLGGCSDRTSTPVPPATQNLPAHPHPVIIIDIDTLRADHLGCYGYDRPTSPNIDRFCAESIVFEWAFSQAPNTPPSQTSILTGLYPGTHGMITKEDRVPEDIVTMAEVMKAKGLSTVGFHDGGYMSNSFNIGQGFEIYEGFGGKGLKAIGPKVFKWLRDHNDSNFLLLVHTYDTHTPYQPEPPFDRLFIDEVPAPSPGFAPTSQQMEKVRLSKYSDHRIVLADNDLGFAMARYDAEIAYVDHWFGEFMALVRELGLDERATIVVISDHGEEFQEHGSVLHEKLYATVTHVPLILRLPGGSVVDRILTTVQAMDIMPTLLDLTGCETPSGVQAQTLLPLIRREDRDQPRLAFGESPFFGERRFVASGDLQLLYTKSTKSSELYDFRQDPLQQNDLAKQRPDDTRVLQDLVVAWDENTRLPFETVDTASGSLDEETHEQLKALGYVQN